MYYVYMCFVDDVLRYIGYGKNDRYKHCTSGRSHVAELNKAVTEGVDIQVYIHKNNLSKELAQKIESKMIANHTATLYNTKIPSVFTTEKDTLSEVFDFCKGFMFNNEFVNLTNTDKLVYSKLKDMAIISGDKKEASVSQQDLSDKFGVSPKTIHRTIKKLLEYNFIKVIRKDVFSNTYVINPIDHIDFCNKHHNENMKRSTSFTPNSWAKSSKNTV